MTQGHRVWTQAREETNATQEEASELSQIRATGGVSSSWGMSHYFKRPGSRWSSSEFQ